MIRLALIALICLAAACASLPEPEARSQPQALVAAAHPDAVDAGLKALEKGGSAVDAAIAVQAVLGLVEPQSSGLMGGAFLIYYDNATGEVSAYEGRETAPASARPDRFLTGGGEPLGFLTAKTSGLSTGAPGVVPMLALAHADHGRLAWADGFETAAALAENGFVIGERLNGLLTRFARFGLQDSPWMGPYFYDADGQARAAGSRLTNPDYAATARAIGANPRALHEGPIAEEILAAVNAQPRPGNMTIDDLARYRPSTSPALCAPYREMTVCGPHPPASGGVAIGMILGLIERMGFEPGGADEPANWTRFVEAQRLAYADRDAYVGDPAFVRVPTEGMLSSTYLDARAKDIDVQVAADTARAGDPWAHQTGEGIAGADATLDAAGTTHFVIVDYDGNVVSMTSTVESLFGSTRMAGGMILNNQLTDFSFQPVDADGTPIANAVAPGKRPRSSMSPTIVLDKDGAFLFATGSPGGNSIIAYTAKSLIGVLDWGLSPQEAAALANVVARGDVVRVETNRAPEWLGPAVRAYGVEVKESAGENSGIHSVLRTADGALIGAADPRREGAVGGGRSAP